MSHQCFFEYRTWRKAAFHPTVARHVKVGFFIMRVIVLGTVMWMCGSMAFAAAPAPPQAPAKPVEAHPCAAAATKFCNDVPYGNGQRIACLAHHNADLTPACRDRVKILQAIFEFGQEQHRKTMAYVAKLHAEAAKKKSAPAPAPEKSTPPAPQ
jgi:hypothetical protein